MVVVYTDFQLEAGVAVPTHGQNRILVIAGRAAAAESILAQGEERF